MEVDINKKYPITQYEEHTDSYVENDLVMDRTMVDFRLTKRQWPEVRTSKLSATPFINMVGRIGGAPISK
eukprot:scaffold115807_cov32-Cyclotella_meneghiniana.AAC.1